MKEFQICFAVSRGTIFEVAYYTLGSNKSAHFATSAAQFNRPRTDYNQCGQAQDSLLKGAARTFYKKWDRLHIKDVTPSEHRAILKDIEQLKVAYPNFKQTDGEDIRFSDAVAVERAFRGVKLTNN